MNKEEILKKYFEEIEKKTLEAYELAKKARSLGLDPYLDVEIDIARDIADRVESLISFKIPSLRNSGLSQRIRELEKEYGFLDWRVGLKIAEEVAKEKFCKFNSVEEAIDAGIRVGLAYITMGVVSAPIEGIVEVRIKNRMDGGKYLAVYYGGPIRTAGGTAASYSVLVADYLRRKFDLQPYDPTDDEVQRYIIEVEEYHARARLQYKPSHEEIRFLIRRVPIEITGDATEDREVPAKKDLPRVETNRIRGGMVLTLAECLAQKLKKFPKKMKKWAEEWGLKDWVDLATEFKKLQEKIHASIEKKENVISKKESEIPIEPNYRYLEQLTAGRLIFAEPMKKGGFRLRYGRSRNTGLAAVGFHPATMVLTGGFIAIGTQLALERPGKAGAAMPVDTIEGPVVKLKNGSVLRVNSYQEALEIKEKVEEILFLGDMLVDVGEFLQNGHILVPSGWVEEWWALEVKEKIQNASEELKEKLKEILRDPLRNVPNAELAIGISKELSVPLHPKYTYHWNEISGEDAKYLWKKLREGLRDDKIEIEDKRAKRILEDLLIPHKVKDGKIIIDGDEFVILKEVFLKNAPKERDYKDGLELINDVSDVEIRRKVGLYIGARMGRPEKSSIRKLKGRPQMLFPVGDEGGRMRNFIEAAEKGYITAEVPLFYCEKCKRWTIYPKCEVCGSKTKRFYVCQVCGKRVPTEVHCGKPTKPTELRKIDPRHYLKIALDNLKVSTPKLLKGVRGMSSKDKIPERLEKGTLRAMHNLYVNKDGTVRFDAIEVPITHFRPKEIGVSVEKLKELGYKYDIYGNPLERDDQILELFPQDIILPDPDVPDKEERSAASVFFRVANFVDDLLEKFYGMKRYYNLKSKEDLVGHLILALAPHTSAGIVARIVGFSKTQTFMAHPYLHAAIRRNCDGDEGGMMLLLDALLNFSRLFLPKKRGGTQDAPLVMTIKLDPKEVDDEVHNMDVVPYYPKEFYEMTQEWKDPGEALEKGYVEIVKNRLGSPRQYYDLWFTHDTTDINLGVRTTAYKELTTMEDKIKLEMEFAKKIRAVSEDFVALLIIRSHFIKDIKGNYRKFFSQVFRCVKCNEKFRRIPLIGKCPKCGGKIILTVTEGAIKKYLSHTLDLLKKYNFDEYSKQDILILNEKIEDLFGKEANQGLGMFLGGKK